MLSRGEIPDAAHSLGEVQPLKILQLSDLHLDAPLADLEPDRRGRRREDLRQVLARAMEAARSRAVDVVLLPGDLVEGDLATLESLRRLAESFESVAPTPVIVAPGNRDPFDAESPWALGTEGLPGRDSAGPWPPNVHVFRSPAFETLSFDGFTVTGIAHATPQEAGRAPLAGLDPPDDDRIHLLLLHGTRAGLPRPRGKAETLGFTTADLVACGFDYAALGHLHEHSVVRDGRGAIVAAYAGSAARLSPVPGEEGSVLTGTVVRDEGIRPDTLEILELDPRRLRALDVPVAGATSREAVRDRVREAVSAACAPDDLAAVVLTGRLDPSIVLEGPRSLSFLAEEGLLFHAWPIDRTQPDYDLEAIRQDRESTRGAFVDGLLEEIATKGQGEEADLLGEALVYGLDAFSGREVRRRDRGDP